MSVERQKMLARTRGSANKLSDLRMHLIIVA